jgi:3-phenylpropionate/trans-cinnamate dioxygenase ferredoxin reductase subunit
VVLRGSLDDGEFTAFYLADEGVTAALSVGRSDELEHARRLMSGVARPHRDALADLDTDLAELGHVAADT